MIIGRGMGSSEPARPITGLATCGKRRRYAVSLGMSANHSRTLERVSRGTRLVVEGEPKLVASSLDALSFGKRRDGLAARYCNRPLQSNESHTRQGQE
jgi:hypothetical protein